MNTKFPDQHCGLRNFCVGVVLAFTLHPAWAEDPPQTLSPQALREQSAEIKTLIKFADSNIQQAQYELALNSLTRAYQISNALSDEKTRKSVLASMANVYYSTGQLEQAHRYYSELVTLDEASGDQPALAISLFNLGHVNASQKKYAEANDNFKRSLAINETLSDASGIAHALRAMGVNAQAQSNIDLARTNLHDALQRFKALNDEQQVAATHRNLGDVAYLDGNLKAAIAHYETALPILAQYAANKPLMRAFQGLSNAYEKSHNFEEAFIKHRAYTRLLKKHLQQQNLETTQRLQVQFETQQFAAANERLELKNLNQKQELRHRQDVVQMQYLIIGLAICIIVLIAISWRRSRQHAHNMRMLATTDELTGLSNRRSILNFGAHEWQRADRFKRPLCCLLFDIDHFKTINDALGHAAGDQVLKTLSAAVKPMLRQTDALGRFGGEEFLLIATETEIQQAEVLAERIRHEISSIKHPEMPDRKVTVSIGIAQLTQETSLEELIARADEALYEAKNQGRNQVAVNAVSAHNAASRSDALLPDMAVMP